MTIARIVVLMVGVGLLLSLGLAFLSAPVITYLGPIGRLDATDFVEDFVGTNVWTGERIPRTWTYTDTNGQKITRVFEVSPEYDQGAIPLPAGFVAGGFLTLAVIAVAKRRTHGPAPETTAPAA